MPEPTAPPRWRYLTQAYVDYRGLEPQPIRLPRRRGVVCSFDERGYLPVPADVGFRVGVVLDGHAYLPDPEGRSYTHWPHA